MQEPATADPLTEQIVSKLKQVGDASGTSKGGISDLPVGSPAHRLVNDLDAYPHAFVIACIANRQVKRDIAWNLPHHIRQAAGDFELETLARLADSAWPTLLKGYRHRFRSALERDLPAAIEVIGDRYGGDAGGIWRAGSSGSAVVRRFLEFDGVGPKIANMAADILNRSFGIRTSQPMPDIAVDTHVLRVFLRLGLLRTGPQDPRKPPKDPRKPTAKRRLIVRLRARELNPEWPGELDWPIRHIGTTRCHPGEPDCEGCEMNSICPSSNVG